MDLCGPMRVESINGKKYVFVIIDDYSRYTWTYFLRSKDETPEVLIDFLRLVQRGLHAQVRTVQTEKGTEFLNKTLHAYFAYEGINHQTSVAQTPEQNGVVERQHRTLVKAARTMLSATKVPLDGENLDKMKEKSDACIFVGYSTQSRAYSVFNKRTRVIVETIHVNFNELPLMASDHVSSDPGPQCQSTEFGHDSLSPGPQYTPDTAENSRPIFDTEPLEKVSHNDNYNVFAIESNHPEQSKSVHDTYLIEQDDHNVIIDSLDMNNDREQIDQNDDDADLTNERELLASLIEKLKCEIDDSKN
nr:hypothetical protein [Tanacetum cinerariifolium]